MMDLFVFVCSISFARSLARSLVWSLGLSYVFRKKQLEIMVFCEVLPFSIGLLFIQFLCERAPLFGETSCCLLNQSGELFDYSLPLLLSLEFILFFFFFLSFFLSLKKNIIILFWISPFFSCGRFAPLQIRRTLDACLELYGHHYMMVNFLL